MKKKPSASSRPAARTARKPRATKLVSMTMDEALKGLASEKPIDPNLSDDDIDYSDIPKITAEEFKNFRPLWVNGRMNLPSPGEAWAAHAAAVKAKAEAGKPLSDKTAPVPVHLDAGLVANLKREAKKKRTTYETLIRRILEDHLAHAR